MSLCLGRGEKEKISKVVGIILTVIFILIEMMKMNKLEVVKENQNENRITET